MQTALDDLANSKDGILRFPKSRPIVNVFENTLTGDILIFKTKQAAVNKLGGNVPAITNCIKTGTLFLNVYKVSIRVKLIQITRLNSTNSRYDNKIPINITTKSTVPKILS